MNVGPGKETSFEYNGSKVADYFDQYGEKDWNRMVQTPVEEVSLHLHSHYLQKYLPLGTRVLEIGAGAGRFTQVLAGLGARILAADISPYQLELNRRHAQQLGFAAAVEDWLVIDICDLGRFAEASFEAVVAYGGPFSYAFDRRQEALQECVRVLQPGGWLFLSVMSLWGSAHRALPGVLEVPPDTNQEITSSGDLSPTKMPQRPGPPLHMFRAGELVDWLGKAGLAVQAVSASGCLAGGWAESLVKVRADPLQWQELLRMELEASAEPGAWDMGTHIIAVVQKGK